MQSDEERGAALFAVRVHAIVSAKFGNTGYAFVIALCSYE